MEDRNLEELAKQERREYLRQWRKKNPDRVKQHVENYWIRRVEHKLKAEQDGEGAK